MAERESTRIHQATVKVGKCIRKELGGLALASHGRGQQELISRREGK